LRAPPCPPAFMPFVFPTLFPFLPFPLCSPFSPVLFVLCLPFFPFRTCSRAAPLQKKMTPTRLNSALSVLLVSSPPPARCKATFRGEVARPHLHFSHIPFNPLPYKNDRQQRLFPPSFEATPFPPVLISQKLEICFFCPPASVDYIFPAFHFYPRMVSPVCPPPPMFPSFVPTQQFCSFSSDSTPFLLLIEAYYLGLTTLGVHLFFFPSPRDFGRQCELICFCLMLKRPARSVLILLFFEARSLLENFTFAPFVPFLLLLFLVPPLTIYTGPFQSASFFFSPEAPNFLNPITTFFSSLPCTRFPPQPLFPWPGGCLLSTLVTFSRHFAGLIPRTLKPCYFPRAVSERFGDSLFEFMENDFV